MNCLLRYFLRHGKTGKVYQDKVFNGVNLSIGRAADQTLFLSDLRVALQHAVISQTHKNRFLLQSKSLFGIWVNGRLAQSVVIGTGDEIKIGNSILKVVEPLQDFDLCLEIEIMPAGKTRLPSKQARPQALWWRSVRGWSWVLFLTVIGFFLLLPLFSVYQQDFYQPYVDQWAEKLNIDTMEQELSLPLMFSQRFWNTGQVASAHYYFQQDCGVCHQNAFEPVTDARCVNCHDQTAPHVEPDFYDLPEIQQTRCAVCHPEHNGKHALVRQDDHLCSQCHQNLQARVDTDLDDASDFGQHHPELRASLLREDNGTFHIERLSERQPQFVETSHLKFSHETHLDRRGLMTLDGVERLWCEDCHQRDKGEKKTHPIDYQKHCANCHPLNFTPLDNNRLVPHGRVAEVLFTLEEYFGNLALLGGYEDFDGEQVPEVVSGQRDVEELTAEQLHAAMAWAKQKAESVGEDVFEFSLCINCHTVEKTQEDPPRWEIATVGISQQWYPKAYFNHEQHKSNTCVTCHLAPESPSSEEILMPTLTTCRECHAGITSPNKLQSTCVDCHGFHTQTDHVMAKKDR